MPLGMRLMQSRVMQTSVGHFLTWSRCGQCMDLAVRHRAVRIEVVHETIGRHTVGCEMVEVSQVIPMLPG